MITEELLDKLCPVKSETDEMEAIAAELQEAGFVVDNMNKGGVFYHLIRIFVTIYTELMQLARNIIANTTVTDASEEWLEIKAPDFGKARKQAVKTQGYLTIHRSDCTNALKITKGHMFKSLPDASGVERKFYAVSETVIGAGEENGRVLVEAAEAGCAYNLSEGRITVSMIHLEGVSAVNNEDGWIYLEGAETEDVESFRTRVKESWSEASELTTEAKLKNVACKVEGVLHVDVDAQHPRGQGTTDIIITGSEGEASEGLLRKVEQATAYLRGNYDDFLYKSVAVTYQDVSLTLYITRGETTEGVKEKAESIIRELMQLSARSEPNSLYMDDIRYALKQGIGNYRRTEFLLPEADIELPVGQIILLGDLQVSVNHVGG